MNIYVKKEDLINVIQNKNLVIKGNVFPIKYIKTLLNIENKIDNMVVFGPIGKTVFSFTYDDTILTEQINVIYLHEDYLCMNYVRDQKLLNDIDYNRLMDVVNKEYKDKYYLFSTPDLPEYDLEKLDEIFYEHVCVPGEYFAFNKWTYDTFKVNQEKLIKENINILTDVYTSLVKEKVNE